MSLTKDSPIEINLGDANGKGGRIEWLIDGILPQSEVIDELSLDDWAEIINVNNEVKGWNTPSIREVVEEFWDNEFATPIPELIEKLEKARTEDQWAALAHTEISEAYEEHRNNKELIYHVDGKPEGLAIEYADALIRILHWFSRHNLMPSRVVAMKMAYNTTRPYRHGGKKT